MAPESLLVQTSPAKFAAPSEIVSLAPLLDAATSSVFDEGAVEEMTQLLPPSALLHSCVVAAAETAYSLRASSEIATLEKMTAEVADLSDHVTP